MVSAHLPKSLLWSPILKSISSGWATSSRKYSPTVRKETTKIDRALVNELQKKYGGTDYHVKAFLKQQQDFLRQVEEARSALNKEFKLLDFGFGFDDMLEACLLYTSPRQRDRQNSRRPSSG